MAIGKTLYRTVRFNPWVERWQQLARTSSSLSLHEIGVSITAGPGDIIIDAGANQGHLTSRFARTGATVYAFEPHPTCFKVCQRRFSHLPNVTVFNNGVMDRPCSLSLTTPAAHDEYDGLDVTVAASFVFDPDSAKADSVDIECIDLAAFIEKLGRPVKLLKVDIEGAEIPVINHLLDTGMMDRVELTVVETHERYSAELAQQTEELRRRVADSGFGDKVRFDWI